MMLKRRRLAEIDLSLDTGPRTWSSLCDCVKQETAIDITEGEDADDDLLMQLNLMWKQLLKRNERSMLAEQIESNVSRINTLQRLEIDALQSVHRYRRRQMMLHSILKTQCDLLDASPHFDACPHVPETLMQAHIRVSEIEVFHSDTPEGKHWLQCLQKAILRLEKEAHIPAELPDQHDENCKFHDASPCTRDTDALALR